MLHEFAPGTKVADIARKLGLDAMDMMMAIENGVITRRKFPDGSHTLEVADTRYQGGVVRLARSETILRLSAEAGCICDAPDSVEPSRMGHMNASAFKVPPRNTSLPQPWSLRP